MFKRRWIRSRRRGLPAEHPAMSNILVVWFIVSHFLPLLSYIGPSYRDQDETYDSQLMSLCPLMDRVQSRQGDGRLTVLPSR